MRYFCCFVAVVAVLLLGRVPVQAADITPLNAGSAGVIDLPMSSAKQLKIEILDGRFQQQSVGKMTLTADVVDFRLGSMQSFGVDINQGLFNAMPVELLSLKTQPLAFDSFELLNHQRLVLDKPVSATVQFRLTEASLNQYFTNPQTLERIEKAIGQKIGMTGLVKLSQPSVSLNKGKIQLNLLASLAGAVGMPLSLTGTLGLDNTGNLALTQTAVASNGVSFLPADASAMFQNKLNEQLSFKRFNRNGLSFTATQLRNSGKSIDIKGVASVTRLEFGR